MKVPVTMRWAGPRGPKPRPPPQELDPLRLALALLVSCGAFLGVLAVIAYSLRDVSLADPEASLAGSPRVLDADEATLVPCAPGARCHDAMPWPRVALDAIADAIGPALRACLAESRAHDPALRDAFSAEAWCRCPAVPAVPAVPGARRQDDIRIQGLRARGQVSPYVVGCLERDLAGVVLSLPAPLEVGPYCNTRLRIEAAGDQLRVEADLP